MALRTFDTAISAPLVVAQGIIKAKNKHIVKLCYEPQIYEIALLTDAQNILKVQYLFFPH